MTEAEKVPEEQWRMMYDVVQRIVRMGTGTGTIECPRCGGVIEYAYTRPAGRPKIGTSILSARCRTEDCVAIVT